MEGPKSPPPRRRVAATRETATPEPVSDDESTRPVEGSLEASLEFEAARRHSAEPEREPQEKEPDQTDLERTDQRPTVRLPVPGPAK